MFKKSIAAAALIAVSSGAYAGGPEAPPPAYIGGVYVDVGISRDDVATSYNQVASQGHSFADGNNVVFGTTSGPNFRNKVNAGAPGWDGFVGLGYNYTWDNEWSLGAEIFGDLSSAKGTQLASSAVSLINGAAVVTSSSLRLTRTFGLSLMPGYYVAPGSLYFMELGYVNSRFELNGFPNPSFTGASNGILAVPTPIFGNPSNITDASGFRFGLGTNTQVGDHVAIRQEYVWEFYGDVAANATTPGQVVTLVNGRPAFIRNTLLTNSISLNPTTGKYNLAAVYYFARQGNAPDLSTSPAHVGGNFYAGINGSYEEVASHALYADVRATTTLNNVITADGTLSQGGRRKITGWNVGLLGGWGYNFPNRWYTGIEVFGNFDSATGTTDLNTSATTTVTNITVVVPGTITNDRLQKQWDFGVAFLPGYQVSDAALLYARVGYVGAQFNNRLQIFNSTNANLTATQNAFLAANTNGKSSWLNGLQLGVGVDTVVYENLSLRTEFDINNYGDFDYTVLSAATPVVAGAQTTTVVSSRDRHLIEDQFNVSLIWHFFG